MPGAKRLLAVVGRLPLRALLVDRGVALGLVALLGVGGLAFANGGYFPASWGWSAVALLWTAALALLLGAGRRPARLELALLGSLALLTGWMCVSVAWSLDTTATVFEIQRLLVYVGAVLTGLVLLRRAAATALVLGVWGAITVVSTYGLATRLFPKSFGTFDPYNGYRLADPVGYWNAFGVLAAIGTALALGLAARGKPFVRCLAAGSLVITSLTLYFTFSRGAWYSLFAGVAVLIALDRRRLQLLTTAFVLAPWPVLAIVVAARSDALTHVDTSIETAARDGHGLAAIAIGLVVVAALAALVLDALEGLVRVPDGLRRFYRGLLLFLLAATLVAVTARYGSPPTLAKKVYRAFSAAPPQETGNLNERLFSLSGSRRTELWHTAWQEAAAEPWHGSGAGTFDVYWFQHRTVAVTVHDSHSLYLETLAELGPLGLVFLAGVLGVPLLALRRARVHPLAAVAAGGYATYLVHAAFDWDWEMPAVTLAALFAALALLAAARDTEPVPKPRARTRYGGAAAVAGLSAFALLGLLGNSAVSSSSQAATAKNWPKAESEARSALHFAPWSAEPWRKLGEAQISTGRLAEARASFLQALDKSPNDWTLWFELAVASHGRQQLDALGSAWELNPLSPELAQFREGLGG